MKAISLMGLSLFSLVLAWCSERTGDDSAVVPPSRFDQSQTSPRTATPRPAQARAPGFVLGELTAKLSLTAEQQTTVEHHRQLENRVQGRPRGRHAFQGGARQKMQTSGPRPASRSARRLPQPAAIFDTLPPTRVSRRCPGELSRLFSVAQDFSRAFAREKSIPASDEMTIGALFILILPVFALIASAWR